MIVGGLDPAAAARGDQFVLRLEGQQRKLRVRRA